MTPAEYTVRIEPHGRTIRVSPAQSILAGALAAGMNVPHSCKSGHCGSCRAVLRSGRIDYPYGAPVGLTADEAARNNILLCQARAQSDLVVQTRLMANVLEAEIKTLPCRIARLRPLSADVMQVFLRLPLVETLPFQPGQYLDVLLDGVRRRSFSIANPPHDSELIELHVRRVAGGDFSERIFTTGGSPRGLLRIEGPIGQFVYQPGLRPLLMVAGGTGFAPLKSMLRHVLERGEQRDIHLYWGARQAQDIYEGELVMEWVRRHPQLRFTVVLSEAARVTEVSQRLGWVHEAVLADHPQLEEFDVYAAGPPALVEAIRASFPLHGVRADRLFFDSFDYATDPLRSGSAHAARQPSGD